MVFTPLSHPPPLCRSNRAIEMMSCHAFLCAILHNNVDFRIILILSVSPSVLHMSIYTHVHPSTSSSVHSSFHPSVHPYTRPTIKRYYELCEKWPTLLYRPVFNMLAENPITNMQNPRTAMGFAIGINTLAMAGAITKMLMMRSECCGYTSCKNPPTNAPMNEPALLAASPREISS